MMLENFASKMLLKSFLKLKMELQHVIKRMVCGWIWFLSNHKLWEILYIYNPYSKYNYYIQFVHVSFYNTIFGLWFINVQQINLKIF